jgi:hypothetical protein
MRDFSECAAHSGVGRCLMGNVPAPTAILIGIAAGGAILLGGLIGIMRVVSWLESDEDDLVPDD